jgi:MinD superfamily P-loop ATPase
MTATGPDLDDEAEAECARCDHCGETGSVMPVTYDAMVDGPGYLVTEELCASCRRAA